MKIGEVVRYYRKRRGMKLRELASIVSVSPTFISLIENDKQSGNMSDFTVAKIATALNIDMKMLLHLMGKQMPKERQEMVSIAEKFFESKLMGK